MRNFTTLLLVLIWATASAHTHIWNKTSQSQGVDAYGNPVTICHWACTYDFNDKHYATTQGQGYCPMPGL